MFYKSTCILFVLIFCLHSSGCAQFVNTCSLPASLQSEIAEHYHASELVTANLLNQEDRKRFKKDHGEACPGLIQIDFFGNGTNTYALLLLNRSRSRPEVELVVATLGKGQEWQLIPLDTADASIVPVIWSEPEGVYEDNLQENKIAATNPVILFVGYESWAIVYTWSGSEVKKIWLSD